MIIKGHNLKQIAYQYNWNRACKGIAPYKGIAKLEIGNHGSIIAQINGKWYTLMFYHDETEQWYPAPLIR